MNDLGFDGAFNYRDTKDYATRLKELAPALLQAASDMGAATLSSPYFKRSVSVAASVAVVPKIEPRRKGRPRAA